jgi:kinesin family protein 1/kinesin family protein 3/17
MSNKELGEGQSPIAEFPSGGQQVILTSKGDPHSYQFDYVFSPTTSQDFVFNSLGKPLLDKAFDGYNSTIFAYGQTGSGKTHTMMNHKGGVTERGLIPRINNGLFERIQTETSASESRRFLVCCSFLEIYNEIIFDLLVPRNKQKQGGGLEIREQKGIGVYVKDLTEVVVDGADKLNQMIEQGFENRMTAATKMNDTSSRSHCIFVIKLHQKDATDESRNTFSKVNLVDLAGSERAKSTEAEGERLKEGANINKSLSALGNVINALSSMSSGSKKVFVPYRNSKLTRVLQESLGGNSLCTMVAAMSPADANAEETLSTLNYARRAKTIKVLLPRMKRLPPSGN